VKLLLDEMFSPVIAEQLRRHGHDVIAVKERPDLVKQPDRIIFVTAQMEGRALVTENVRHFRELVLSECDSPGAHAGVIYTTERTFFRGDRTAVGRIVMALDAILTSERDIRGLEVWLRPV
jgi:hypothetical protein